MQVFQQERKGKQMSRAMKRPSFSQREKERRESSCYGWLPFFFLVPIPCKALCLSCPCVLCMPFIHKIPKLVSVSCYQGIPKSICAYGTQGEVTIWSH